MFFLVKLLIILVGLIGLLIMPYLSLTSLGHAFSQELKKEKRSGMSHSDLAHLVSSYSTFSVTQDVSTLVYKIQDRYQSIQSFTTDYYRKSTFGSTSQELVRTVEGSGRLFWSRPLLLKLEQDKPQNEQIIVRDIKWWRLFFANFYLPLAATDLLQFNFNLSANREII